MILLQIYFTVAEEEATAFEAMFADAYAPAMEKQPGYLGSTLLRLFPRMLPRRSAQPRPLTTTRWSCALIRRPTGGAGQPARNTRWSGPWPRECPVRWPGGDMMWWGEGGSHREKVGEGIESAIAGTS